MEIIITILYCISAKMFKVFGKLLEKLPNKIYNILELKRGGNYKWQQKKKIYGY